MRKEKVKSKMGSIILMIILVCSGLLFSAQFNSIMDTAIAGSTWTQTSDKDFDNGTLTNLTIVGNGDNADLRIDISDLKHWLQKSPSSSPSSRGYHTGCSIDGDDKVVIFGGYYNRDDTWEYDLSDNTWTDKTKTTKPSGRSYSGMASIDGDDKGVLFGGYSNPPMDDTWVYDSSLGTWSETSPATSPSGRYGNAMATIYGDDRVMLFGGATWSGGWTYFNDTYIYDLSDTLWYPMSPTNHPSGRFGSTMATFDGTKKVLLFGGLSSWNNYIGGTWLYDYSTNAWTNQNPSGGSPSARGYSTMAPIPGDDKIVLFGGMNGYNSYFNDTWVYDLSDNKWTKLDTRNTEPASRATHTMSVIDGTDKVLLFGGMTSYNQYNGETWLFKPHLPLRNGTYISAPYDTGSECDFLALSWFAKTPQNTEITIQLRTADTEEALATQPFIGPDGTSGSFYTSPTAIWDGHYGDRWVQYIAYFNLTVVDKSPSLEDLTITYNCLPNTIVVSPSDETLLTNNKPTFKWTFEDLDSEKQVAFQIVIDDLINFSSIDFDSGEQTTATEQWDFPTGTTYTELPDGIWYWKVRTKDADGAWTDFSQPRKLWIDTQLPNSAPNYPANDGYYNSVSQITGVAYEGATGSGINKIEIAIKRFSDNNYWIGTTWVPLQNWILANGTANWSYDTSAIKWTTGTKYSIQSRATDNALNVEITSVSNIFYIDKDSPMSKIDHPIDNIWIKELNSISGTAMDISGAGVDEIEISIQCTKDYNNWDSGAKENDYWDGSAWTAAKTWLSATGTNEWSFETTDVSWTTGDHYTILSRGIDKTDNVEKPNQGVTFLYDAQPPENLGIFINNDDEYTSSSSVLLSLTADDVGSGLANMAFSTDSAVWSNWEDFNTSRSFELPAGDGKKTIYFRVQDFTENIANPVADTIILDTTPPEDLSVVIEDNAKYANTNRVKVDVKASDKLSGVGEISFSYDGVKWLDWGPFTQTRFINFPGDISQGEVKIFFRAKDNVENIAEPVYDSIILDTMPPHSLSVLINSGLTETNQTSVTLALNAADNTSGISQISFSNDGETWTEWEEYNIAKSYVLPLGNGKKTIYFRVRDNAGNIGGPTSSSIILNITTPQKEGKSVKSPASTGLELWMIMLILAIVIIILIVVSMVVITKRKKKKEQEVVTPGALTIRPGGLGGPVISFDQMRRSMDQPQLGGAGAAGTTGRAAPAQLPMLAKSTQTAMAQPTVAGAQKTAQAGTPQPLPALPPARISQTATATATGTGAGTTTPTSPTVKPTPTVAKPATPTPTPKVAPTPTVSTATATTPTPTTAQAQPRVQPTTQPQVTATPTPTPTPSVAKPTINGPSVHLPGATPTQQQQVKPKDTQN